MPWKGLQNIDPENDPNATPGSVPSGPTINTNIHDVNRYLLRDRNGGRNRGKATYVTLWLTLQFCCQQLCFESSFLHICESLLDEYFGGSKDKNCYWLELRAHEISNAIGVLFWVNTALPFCLCTLFLIFVPYFLVQVNCLIWSPPGHRGPSPRAKPLCHTSYGKFLRGHAAPQPLHDRHQDSQTASPLLLGVATLWAWLQVGMVLTPLVSALFCTMKHTYIRETPK